MLCLTCTMISRVDLAHYGVKIWESVDCGTIENIGRVIYLGVNIMFDLKLKFHLKMLAQDQTEHLASLVNLYA